MEVVVVVADRNRDTEVVVVVGLDTGMAAVADIVLEAAEPNIDIEPVAVVDIEPVVGLDTDTVVAVADIGPVVAPCSDTAIAADIEPVVAPGALVDRKAVVNCP